MINTAIEGAIDVATTEFDPLAKLAKDIAAGAVLIAAINAVAVAYLVFSGKAAVRTSKLIDRVRDQPGELTIAAFIIVIIAVIAIKAATGRGTPLRGGLPSGHAALAFAAWIAITYAAGAGPSLPGLDDRVARRAPRRPDPGRVGRPFLGRSAPRRDARRTADTGDLPVLVVAAPTLHP